MAKARSPIPEGFHSVTPHLFFDDSPRAIDWYKQAFDLRTGKFSGFTGCNQMNGAFHVQGARLHFSEDITLTRMACEGYNEKEFVVNLLRVDHYEIRNGVLTLLIGQTPVSKWMRRPDVKRTV